jgi:hypothetical protein
MALKKTTNCSQRDDVFIYLFLELWRGEGICGDSIFWHIYQAPSRPLGGSAIIKLTILHPFAKLLPPTTTIARIVRLKKIFYKPVG